MHDDIVELVSNRKAFHDYTIEESFEAGVVLLGTEVKSLKNHGGSLQDAFVLYDKGELWMKNSSIAPYSQASFFLMKIAATANFFCIKTRLKSLQKF